MKSNMKFDSMMQLTGLPEGLPARIEAIEVAGSDLSRLEVMGLCAGRTVEVVQAGDPMIVRVLGTRIGLASVLARSVHVRAVR